MVGAWSAGYVHRFLTGKPEGEDCLKDLGINVRMILKWVLGKYGWRVWIGELYQYRDQWQGLLNMVMNL